MLQRRRLTWAALGVLACTGDVPTPRPPDPVVPPRGSLPAAEVQPSASALASPLASPLASAVVPVTTTAVAVAPPEAPCPDDMLAVASFCIDRYEAPNVAGHKPLLMQSALDGEAWCRQRGKRLCRENEWVRACTGKRGHNFPYGPSHAAGRCNDDKTWIAPSWRKIRSWPSEESKREAARLDQSEPGGARAECQSEDGVFDLTGNAAEWVVRTEDNDTNHDHVVKGCYWARCFRPPHTPACDYVNFAHQGAERSYEMGFRCCRDVSIRGANRSD